MKIIIADDSNGSAHHYDRVGFARVLQYCGHEVQIWKLGQKGAFDTFADMGGCDLFMGQLHSIDRATIKCLTTYGPKVILKAGHWGAVNNDVDTDKYPVLVASKEHITTAFQLQDNGVLDFVFVHYHPDDIEYTMGDWTKSGLKAVGIMNAFDTFSYIGGENRGEFQSDLSFIGGNWPYKNQMLKKYLYPLCNPIGKFNIKIYGNSSHPVGQYVGGIEEENVKYMFVSSKINLDVAEPHAYDFKFDISEKLFKVAGAGGFYLSLGYVKAQQESLFKNSLIQYVKFPESAQEFSIENNIQWWLDHIPERENSRIALHKEVIERHTYFDRVSQTFSELGLLEDSKQVIVKKNEFLKAKGI